MLYKACYAVYHRHPCNAVSHTCDMYRYMKEENRENWKTHTKLGSVAMETLTEDTASSKPSDPQLITSANTPSKQTLYWDTPTEVNNNNECSNWHYCYIQYNHAVRRGSASPGALGIPHQTPYYSSVWHLCISGRELTLRLAECKIKDSLEFRNVFQGHI